MLKIKKNSVLRDLDVTDISTEGKGIGRHEGVVVFTEGAVPGDKVDVHITKTKQSYAEGYLSRIVAPSGHRTIPVCEHFSVCGGCKWQNLAYSEQLRFKQKYVADALVRLGKLEVKKMHPIAGCSDPYYYRNKLEYSFSAKRWLTRMEMAHGTSEPDSGLGYHISGMFDKVLDIRNCYLQPEPSNSIRNAVKQFALANNLSFYDIRNKTGFLRTLLIRNTLMGELMVLVAVYEWHEKELFTLLEFLKTTFPQITSLQYVHNPKANDTLADLEIKTYSGRDHIVEEMEGLRFRISARSFFQTNSAQALYLYRAARQFAGLTGKETVYDLYTGTGTIANFLAKSAAKVIGIEYVADAVADAVQNSRDNGINNTAFFAGDMKDILNDEFIATHGRPDVIITDPPRAGMHEDVVKTILRVAPDRIVYVSCNPGTQARDMALLNTAYELLEMQPVDMFPQTTHVETVALLQRRAEAPID